MINIFKLLKIAFFPRRCQLCGNVVAFDVELCDECKRLKMIEPPLCLRCGANRKDCTCKKHGKQREVEYKAVVAPYYYEGTVAEGVLHFKMNNMPFLAEKQGKAIAYAVNQYYELIDFDFVTFIPMLKRDEINREFNQSRLLAEVVSKQCDIPLVDALVKTKKTKKQKRQNARDRFANVYNAYKVRGGVDVKDAKILLIDDVKTTGSTLTSAAMTLKAYGAKSVHCATFAVRKYDNKTK